MQSMQFNPLQYCPSVPSWISRVLFEFFYSFVPLYLNFSFKILWPFDQCWNCLNFFDLASLHLHAIKRIPRFFLLNCGKLLALRRFRGLFRCETTDISLPVPRSNNRQRKRQIKLLSSPRCPVRRAPTAEKHVQTTLNNDWNYQPSHHGRLAMWIAC